MTQGMQQPAPQGARNPLEPSIHRAFALSDGQVARLCSALRSQQVSFPTEPLHLPPGVSDCQARLRAWLCSSGMRADADWTRLLTGALRPGVTYLHFMRVPDDRVGTLLVETG